MSAAPVKISSVRMTIAPATPKNSTRCWYSRGTDRAEKMSTKRKTLSIDSDFSMT